MKIKKFQSLVIAASALLSAAFTAEAQSIVDRVKQRGYLSCGASQGVPGLSRPDDKGVWTGFDVDTCRAIAAAVLGDKEKVRFVPLNAAQRLPALQTGEIDVLARTTTWTFTRDLAVRFVATNLYDGDAVMIRKSLNITDAKHLDGLTLCLQGGGSLLENALDSIESTHQIKTTRVYFDSTILARDAYFAGRCDGYMTDGIAAAGQRAAAAKDPGEHDIFVSGQTTEPLAVAIPRGDDRWFDMVRYAVNMPIWAEYNGITSANIDEMAAKATDSEVKKGLGVDPGLGEAIGLDDKWGYNVIKQVGNYAEIWDRNLGNDSPLKVERKLNRLFNDGGLMFPVPLK